MPGSTATHELDLIIEKKTGDGGGGELPPTGRNGGGDDGKQPKGGSPSSKRYYTGMALGIVSILMFFMSLAAAFLVLRSSSHWIPVRIHTLMWINTVVLLASSVTLEQARQQLAQGKLSAYRHLWAITTALASALLSRLIIAAL